MHIACFRLLALASALVASALAREARADVFCVGRGAATHASLAAAVAAAAANGPEQDFIYLDTITHAVPDRVLIENQSVAIVGGFEFCQTQLAPTGIATLNGAGGAAGSVIEVRTTNSTPREVSFERVTLTGGEDDATGGALHLTGTHLSVRLGPQTTLTGNTGAFGGAVFVGGGSLFLEQVAMLNNVAAQAGGAVDCVSAQVFVSEESSVRFNQAQRGGGFSLRDDCSVIFYGGNAQSLFGNRADIEGGGIVASNGATVQIVRGQPGDPGPIGRERSLRIAANQAGSRGAGISLQQGARLYANGVTLVSNNVSVPSGETVEPLGGAIHAGADTVVVLSTDPRCAPDEACNLLLNNVINRNAPSFAAGGAGLAAVGADVVAVRNTEFSGNMLNGGSGSASAMLLLNLGTGAELSRLLFHHNGSTDGSSVPHVLQISGAPLAQLDFLTVVDNALSGSGRAAVRLAGIDLLTWRSSLVDAGSDATASVTTSPQPHVDCLLARELTSVPAATRSFALAPVFRDRGAGDYRPAPGAPQVDVCDGPILGGGLDPEVPDLDQRPVPVDAVTVDVFGAYDLGAYELQAPSGDGALFADGFEAP